MNGHHSLFSSSVIIHELGWVAWKTSMTASFIVFGIVRRLSSSMQPSFTLNWFQWACIYLLTALHLLSLFWTMQSLISLRTLSLFVIAAINFELNTSLIALSSIVFDVVLTSLLGLRYVAKESGLFPGFLGGVFSFGSCSDCISRETCFWVSNWLLFGIYSVSPPPPKFFYDPQLQIISRYKECCYVRK